MPKWYPWPELPVFGIFCREHARALATRHEVAVLASLATPKPDFLVFRLTDEVEDGLRTLRVRYRRPWFRPAAMGCQLLGMLVALRRLRREGFKPDVVHAHVFSAGLPALLHGTPVPGRGGGHRALHRLPARADHGSRPAGSRAWPSGAPTWWPP